MCEITLRGLEGFFSFLLFVVVVSEAVVQGFVNSQRGSGVCSSDMAVVRVVVLVLYGIDGNEILCIERW